MSDFFNHNTNDFAPEPEDSIRELRSKAEGMLEYLRENEAWLRKFPLSAVDERRALWQSLADWLAKSADQPELVWEARMEAQRVWAEELHHTALLMVTMAVQVRASNVRQAFADDPEQLEELIVTLDVARLAAIKILPVAELDALRKHGFLRPGE